MRRVLGVVCGLAALACSESTPSSPEEFRSLASILSDGGSANRRDGSTDMETQLLNALESPPCPSDSRGHAHLKINQNGTIDSDVQIGNRGNESVRFGHIHHLNTGAATGPIIWWLTSPIGVDLNLTAKHLAFSQQAVFTTNTHYASHAAALAALLTSPEQFYVNFHSDNCPGGFARGFLP